MSCFEADCIDIACREWLEIAPRRMRHARIPARRRPAGRPAGRPVICIIDHVRVMLLGNVNTAVAKSSAHCVTVSVYTCMNLSPFLLRRSMSTSAVSSYDGERRKPKGAVLFTGKS